MKITVSYEVDDVQCEATVSYEAKDAKPSDGLATKDFVGIDVASLTAKVNRFVTGLYADAGY